MVSMGARVGSHRSGQTRILFPVLTRDLKPLSKTNLATNILPCKKKKKKKTNLIPIKPRISLYGLDFRPKVFIFL